MRHGTSKLPIGKMASALALLVVGGCAEYHMPRIDPSGNHLFICDSGPAAPPPVASYQPGTVPVMAPVPAPVIAPAPVPAPATTGLQPIPMQQPIAAPPVAVVVSPYSDAAVTLVPCSRVAPIGAEVILVAGVRGGDNYLRTNRHLDWFIAPGSVGQFTDVGGKNFEDYLVADFSRPRIVSSTSAVGTTTRVSERVGQGDNTYIARGESWIALRSPVEGVTRVTVAAPEVVVPAERAKTATIYWYDAQYRFPEPVVTPPGTKGTLTTSVWKLTSRCPRAGWIVRYELTGGPQAIFVPSGSTAVEVPTDATGRASVEIVQKDPSPGTSQIRVQLFRPADQSSPRFMVRDGFTAVSWTGQTGASPVPSLAAPALPGPASAAPPAINPRPILTPPPGTRPALPAVSVLELKVTQRTAAIVGSNVTFDVEITNRGATIASGVTVRDTFDPGLEPQSSAPGFDPRSSVPIEFRAGNLGPGETYRRSVTFRVTKPGQLCHRMEAVAADGGRAVPQNSCVTAVAPAITNPTPPAATYPGANTPPPAVAPVSPPPEIRVTAQAATATVGQSVVFTAIIRNSSQQPLPNVRIIQQSDAVLTVSNSTEFGIQRGSELVWNLPSLPPGRDVRVQVQCECRQATPKACCRFTVALSDGRTVADQACVEITAANPLPINPLPANPVPSGSGTAPPTAAPSRLTVSVGNRNTVNAGSNQQFVVSVGNDGEAAENDIVVTAQLPPGSLLVPAESDQSATLQQQSGVVSFSRITELPPHAFKSFRITVTTSKSGPICLQAEATSRRQTQPARGSTTVEVLP